MPVQATPRLSYTVNARSIGSGISRAEIAGRSAEIELDTSAAMIETVPGPADLLVSAFAACMLKNVERFSQMLPFRYERATVRVTAEREENPPRMASIRYELTVITDEPQRRLDLLHRNIVKHGTIFNTLANACEVTGTITAVTPEAPPAEYAQDR